MSALGRARGALASRHIVVCVLVLVASGLAVAGEKKQRPDWRMERLLIVGIPSFEVADWGEFLEGKEIPYRYDRRTHTIYVQADPLPVLEEAGQEKALAQTVKRGYLERKLEAQMRGEFPNVKDPRVCLAFPTDGPIPVEDDSEPIAMVLAGGLRLEEMEQVKYRVADEVEGLPARNVIVMGGRWRPWPGYGGKIEMRTPRKSVAITQTARAEQ